MDIAGVVIITAQMPLWECGLTASNAKVR